MGTRIALIGHGAIGHDLIRHLSPELDAGALVAVGAVVRRPDADRDAPPGGVVTIDEAIERADLVVECAGVAAARALGPAVVAAGRTLLVASVGALADPGTAERLGAGPGRLVLTAGAIGGLDLIRAASQAGGLDAATITTTKAAASLAQPWMGEVQTRRLRSLDAPEVLFDGAPVEAIERFPGNVNVAVALGVAMRGRGPIADGLARVRVRIVADPRAERATHVIEAHGATGEYRFEFAGRPSAGNPRSSALTAQALAAEVRELLGAPPPHA